MRPNAPGLLRVAQWALQSEPAEALAQMSARLAKGEGPLVDLVRKRQDLMTRAAHRGQTPACRRRPSRRRAVQALRASIANLETRSCGNRCRAERQIPRLRHLRRAQAAEHCRGANAAQRR